MVAPGQHRITAKLALAALLTLVALFKLAAPAYSQSDEEQARTQLQRLEQDIARIQAEIGSAGTQRDKLQGELRSAEVQLGKLLRDIKRSERDIDGGERQLKELEAEQGRLSAARDEQKARITTELNAAWRMGREGQLKLLLSQDSPDTVSRTLTYYRYFLKARQERLAAYRATLTELAATSASIDETLASLRKQREDLTEQRSRLDGAQREREQALARVTASISDKSQQLKQKQESRKELESLLAAIETAIDKLEVPDNYQDFAAAKGSMPWPLDGKPSNRFGRPRNEGKMRWQGVTIPAEAGTTVQAIHHGRVVYADWLRGSGLLLIVDHGDGYMSLYAHNQSLLRDVGEWVSAGTPVSTVGDTGGQGRNALYFEVRHKGKPVDPSKWCRG